VELESICFNKGRNLSFLLQLTEMFYKVPIKHASITPEKLSVRHNPISPEVFTASGSVSSHAYDSGPNDSPPSKTCAHSEAAPMFGETDVPTNNNRSQKAQISEENLESNIRKRLHLKYKTTGLRNFPNKKWRKRSSEVKLRARYTSQNYAAKLVVCDSLDKYDNGSAPTCCKSCCLIARAISLGI